MVSQILRKTTSPPKCPPYPLPHPAIVPFYPYGVFLPRFLIVFPKCRKKPWTLPQQVDTKISGKYNGRGEKDGNERQRTAGILQRV
jgi:hypothetical protein